MDPRRIDPHSTCGRKPPPRTQRGPVWQAAPVVFEPHIDSQALTAQLLVVAVTATTAGYWWWSVVPSARRSLAREKRSGPLNDYLVDLQTNPDKPLERWFYTDWLKQLQRRQELAATAAAKRIEAATQRNEADGLLSQPGQLLGMEQQQQQQQVLQQQQQLARPQDGADRMGMNLQDSGASGPATQADRDPFFWSLDNPLLATAAMLAGIALISAALHSQ